MNTFLVIVTFGVIIGGHGASVNHCTSLLPSLYIVPRRVALKTNKASIFDEQLSVVYDFEKVQGLPKGTSAVYVKSLENNILYEIIAIERGLPRGQRQVRIKSSKGILPLFIGSEGPKGNPSFTIRVEGEDGQFLVVRCVDTMLYRYQIEDEFTKAIEAHVVKMSVPVGNANTYTISFRSPIQRNKPVILALAIAMDELLM